MLIAFSDSCRHLKFASPVDGFALEGHVIKNLSLYVGMLSSCIARCTMERHCVSFNIGPLIKDHVLCQLSDSHRIRHPDDLKPKKGFTYRGTEVKEVPYNSFHCTVVWFFRLLIFFDVACFCFLNACWSVGYLILILTYCTFFVIRTRAPVAHAFITRSAWSQTRDTNVCVQLVTREWTVK